MPAHITKLKNGKFQVATPNGIHAKGTSLLNAKKQKRLLDAVDHGWKPSGKK